MFLSVEFARIKFIKDTRKIAWEIGEISFNLKGKITTTLQQFQCRILERFKNITFVVQFALAGLLDI